MIDWQLWLSVLWVGLTVTISLAAVTSLFSIFLSWALAIATICPLRGVRFGARLYVDLFRSIPLLAFLIFIYYGLGKYEGRLGITGFWVAVAGFTVIESAYLAELYRGALQSIRPMQWQAASSLGMGWFATLRHVILPQALPPALPITVNMVIGILKDSSLASLIAVPEVTLAAGDLVSETFLPMQVFLVLAGFYLALIVPVSLFARWMEAFINRRVGFQMRPGTTQVAVSGGGLR